MEHGHTPRHRSFADAYLSISTRVESIAHEYCANTGCPDEQGIEALLSAAAHYALRSQKVDTFDRVAEKLRGQLQRMVQENPQLFEQP